MADSTLKKILSCSRQKMILLLPILFLLLHLPLLYLNCLPCNDTALRYAPMAEAFANGNFACAFHPRFGLFFPIWSGCTAFITQLDGFRSCQIASLLLFILTAYPIYGIACKLFDRITACRAMLLYLLSSHLLRTAVEGLREPGKALGFMLAVYGVLSVYTRQERYAGYFLTACGCAILTTIRGDGALIALILFIWMVVLEIRHSGIKFYRSLLAGLVMFLLITPQLVYVCKLTGYPVPDVRCSMLLKKLNVPVLTTPDLELP